MTKSVYAKLFLATTILGLAGALSACGSGADQAAAPGGPDAPVTQATEPTTATPSATEPTPTASTATPPTADPNGKPADVGTGDGGCPVSEDTLLKIINTTEDFATTVALHDRQCYNGWASGKQEISKEWTAAHGQAQPMAFVFRYDRKAGRWVYASAGTSDICRADVPADVRRNLRVCSY
ncbi:hypothetical protein [Virgisporangium aurantiacum]|uniref:Lipoprotein n=1 Tax=Virgisporangium aurantiacum TaxID=175570 RepID=A0A8J3ZDC1_9ACTN|nr:hypothetical protein [Virgisporangium aurantiacum]GIJ59715.1 hypothetical protein Vau01_072310 [Virgisporangium aurantiacum]